MAMNRNPDKDITQSDKVLDLHKDLPPGKGNENNSAEGICKSEHGPISYSEDQSRSHDGFPGLSGSSQKRGPRSEPASDFGAQGLANRKVLDIRSNGNERLGNSTTLISESGNRPAESDTNESASIHARDQLRGSRNLSFLESGSTSATSSRVNHEARQMPKSSVSMSNEMTDGRNEPLGPPLEDPASHPAPHAVEPDQASELETMKCCSTTSASVSKSLTVSRDGNEDTSFRGANAVPLHAEDVRSTVTTPQPAIPMIPGLNKQASSRLFPRKRQQEQTPEKPSEPSHAPQNNLSSSAKATSHFFEPHSITPFTPTSNKEIQHLKSFSADAPVIYQSPTSSSPATLISPYRKDHARSVSHGYFNFYPSYGSVMPETPRRPSSAQHARQTSMETPFTPIQLRNLGHPGAPLQPSLGHHYPGPHQHTPEGQGQYFVIQESMPPFMPPLRPPFMLPFMPPSMPAHFSGSFSPNIPPFSYSVDYSNNDAIDQNAQVYKQGEQNAEYSQSNHFDSYASSQAANAAPNAADLHQNGNMYTQDTNGFGPRFYSNHTDPAHQVRLCPVRMGHARLIKTQLNQNLYSPLEPHREPSKPNQRTAKDLFIPEDLRLKLHARTEATLRVFAGRLL